MRLQIDPADGPAFEREFDEDALVIGRSSSSDLALADPFLSRHHARLFRRGEKILLEDLQSRNGTELNGTLITEPTVVSPGDVIKVSGSTIRIRDQGGIGTTTDFGATVLRRATELLRASELDTQTDEETEDSALRGYAERLRKLNGIHEELGRSVSLEQLLELVLVKAFDEMKPDQAAVFLCQEDGEVVRAATRSRAGDENPIPISRHLIDEVCTKGMAAIVVDAATDERFASAQSLILTGLRSLLAAPLLADDRTLGMVVLSSKMAQREFDEADLQFLVSMASIAALKIRNVALAEEAAERRRMEKDLALARRIQESLIPDHLPALPGWRVYARNHPSRFVSGDYYQICTRRDDTECVAVIADVSGKGIPAALLTASLEALSAGPIEIGDDPVKVCSDLSRRLYHRSPPEKFATAIVGVMELATGKLTYTNAGHNPGVLLRANGVVDQLEPHGVPLGLVPRAEYDSTAVTLELGDTIVLYTDGITEAEDADGVQYGLRQLIAAVAPCAGQPPDSIAAALEDDLHRHIGDAPPLDDRTLVIVQRVEA